MNKPTIPYLAIRGIPKLNHQCLLLPVGSSNPNVTGDGNTWALTSPVVRIDDTPSGLIVETRNTIYVPAS